MDKKPDFVIKIYDWSIKICAVLLAVFFVFYSVIYLLRLDWIYWASTSSCFLVLLFALLVSKFIFKSKLPEGTEQNNNSKETKIRLVILLVFFVISIVMAAFAFRQLANYSYCYSPNKTNKILIERQTWNNEKFIYGYKMKYGMFKVVEEYWFFFDQELANKSSVIVWGNEDSAYVEGKHLVTYTDKDKVLIPANLNEKYFLNFD